MSGGNPLMWPLVLLAVGLALMFLETMVPSGGLIGILSLGCLGLCLYNAFSVSLTTGLWFALALGVLAPIALCLALYIWPKTPMGRRLTLAPPEPEEIRDDPIHGQRLDHLIGSLGRALTPLRPSGMADFEGRRVDVRSEEGMIPAGTLIKALSISNGQLVVRVADEPALDQLLGP